MAAAENLSTAAVGGPNRPEFDIDGVKFEVLKPEQVRKFIS